VRWAKTRVVEYLADIDLLVLLCGNCRRYFEYCPFVFIPLNTSVAKKLEKNLPPNHVVSNFSRSLQRL